jgi:hypothetical protein
MINSYIAKRQETGRSGRPVNLEATFFCDVKNLFGFKSAGGPLFRLVGTNHIRGVCNRQFLHYYHYSKLNADTKMQSPAGIEPVG